MNAHQVLGVLVSIVGTFMAVAGGRWDMNFLCGVGILVLLVGLLWFGLGRMLGGESGPRETSPFDDPHMARPNPGAKKAQRPAGYRGAQSMTMPEDRGPGR